MFKFAPHFRLQEWVAAHGIFEDGRVGAGRYEEAVVVTLAA